ncbi:MAG: rhodanese-like domain-containing protein [Candidatus Thioglobus sp.]|nr:rhodanese-like domain-containing protein [Candidatus Thioglobus sp.]
MSLNSVATFSTISTEKVQQAKQDGVPIIDIRRIDEFQKYGIIPGSHKLTFYDKNGNYNTQKWLSKFSEIVKDKNQPFVLVCAHANRTKTVGRFLSDKLGYKNVQELSGGILDGWIGKNLATTKLLNQPKSWWKFWQ